MTPLINSVEEAKAYMKGVNVGRHDRAHRVRR
jgi:hypothetical protein